MLDLMVAPRTIDARVPDTRPGSQPYQDPDPHRDRSRDRDMTRSSGPSTRGRATDWWASRIARLPTGAAYPPPSA